MKNKIIIVCILSSLILGALVWFGVQKLFPIINCGESSYYQFRDIEGPYYTLNVKNNQFRYNLIPSLFWTEREKDYPLIAIMGDIFPKSDPHYFVAKSGDDISKDIQNLNKCFPALNIKIVSAP